MALRRLGLVGVAICAVIAAAYSWWAGMDSDRRATAQRELELRNAELKAEFERLDPAKAFKLPGVRRLPQNLDARCSPQVVGFVRALGGLPADQAPSCWKVSFEDGRSGFQAQFFADGPVSDVAPRIHERIRGAREAEALLGAPLGEPRSATGIRAALVRFETAKGLIQARLNWGEARKQTSVAISLIEPKVP